MGTITRKYQEKVDSIVTESYVYTPIDFSIDKPVRRVKVLRSLWDTGASVTLISARVAKVLELKSIGKFGVYMSKLGKTFAQILRKEQTKRDREI